VLPVFEPASVVTNDAGIAVAPGRGLEIAESRLEPPDGVALHVEEARATGPRRYIAPGPRACGSPLHSNRELPDRLTGIWQIEHVVACIDAADCGGHID